MMLEDRYILLAHKRFSGQLSDTERSELDSWIQSDPSNGILVDQLYVLWTESKSYHPEISPDTEKAKSVFFSQLAKEEAQVKPVVHIQPEIKIRRIYQWAAIAAGLIIVVGAFLFFNLRSDGLPSFMQGEELTADFKNAENIEFLELPDGTRIWVKPGTKISMAKDFNQKYRDIYLEGEIFAKVSPERSKPFRIIMEHSKVEVLGTSFYLNSGKKGDGYLKLLEGKVRFSGKTSDFTLENMGEILWHVSQDSIIIPDSAYQISADWVNDYIIFENATLQEVFDKLSRHYAVRFQIDCPGIDKMKGFTSFIHQQDNPKLSSYMEAVKKVYNLEIRNTSENVYHVTGEPCF
jgi:transmembrane sensor